MQDKLKLLLDKINLPSSYYDAFLNGKILKLKLDKSRKNGVFIIEVENELDEDIITFFNENIKNGFRDMESIRADFIVRNVDYKDAVKHYEKAIENSLLTKPMKELFKEKNVTVNDKCLTVDLDNIAEENIFRNQLESIERYFKSIGFTELEIKVFVNEESSKKIRMELEKEVKKEVSVKPKTDNLVVFGEEPKGKITEIKDIIMEEGNVTVEAYVFGNEKFESNKNSFKILTLKISDNTDSMYAKFFTKNPDDFNKISKEMSSGWFRINGYVKQDVYAKDLVLTIRNVVKIPSKDLTIKDDAPLKRVELHAHTMMSQMDGVIDEVNLVKTAIKLGHKAIAITDHNGCQAFPHVFSTITAHNKSLPEGEEHFKGLYGSELVMVDDTIKIVVRPNDSKLMENTYVVFDLETTGFNAGGVDSIIEIGAVKLKNGEIIDRYDQLIDPGHKLNPRITEVTSITDAMLAGKPNEEEAVKDFIKWTGDLPMVAHNAKFDTSFLSMAYQKYNLGEYKNTVIDTLELSRTLDSNYARHSLSALVKRYDVPFDEESHHRGDYDAQGTALVFHKMLKKLVDRNFETIKDLDKLVSKDEIHKYGRTYHVNLIAKTREGLKNLFKLISLANTKYLYKTPRILRSEIENKRQGLLVGSGCYESEVFVEARSKSDEELTNIINFYDYVEVQPPEVYDHLIQMGDFANKEELLENIRKIVDAVENAGKIIVATGDVHHLTRNDKIYREIIINQRVPGGGRHPLARKEITSIPSQHFRTTDEMLECFSFLGKDKAYEIVVTNTNKIADMVGEFEVIIDTGGVPFSPKIDNSVETVTDLVYTRAKDWYGNVLPKSIEERIAKELYGDAVLNAIKRKLDKEGQLTGEEYLNEAFRRLHEVILKGFDAVKKLVKDDIIENSEEKQSEEELDKLVKKTLGGIIGGGFDVIYLIAQKLVKHSNDDGYLVGSRGSVGSSFVATMMGITEVNPLPAHYRCLKCKTSIFNDEDGNPLGSNFSTGFDLPDKICPNCGEKLYKDGQDMPFATFLGFNADKVPDIDLNFSGLNQASAHEYTKVLFGVDNVYRAGTIGTVADKTAYGFVKGYCEDKGINKRPAEIERLAKGCTGVKRTTGQHPGGIVVIPGYMDVFDFTPYQFPADDPTSAWRTTHFDYHAIDQDVLKLDILGHVDPTHLRMLQDLSGMDVTKVPLDDKDTMSIFTSTKALGVTPEQIMCKIGTLGIPEFGTKFTIGMLEETKPTTFGELIKISGLSHGTDVWVGNAQELIKNNIVPFKDVIGCRDDIMVYLMYHGVEPIKAFKIMEFVRKGRASKDPETWKLHEKTMQEANIEPWFIDSCSKIKYMFPKAHAAAYVISAFRVAYFKVHHPAWYYASYFSVRCDDFDIETMIKGYDAIKSKIIDITNKGFEVSNKESSILDVLKIALEATARGITFKPIDLYKSDAVNFVIAEDGKSLYPPFRSIDGLGETVALKIVEERNKASYLSIEDLQVRGKVSATLIDRMRLMGILNDLPESSQLSLF